VTPAEYLRITVLAVYLHRLCWKGQVLGRRRCGGDCTCSIRGRAAAGSYEVLRAATTR
jgi:hypothetical protein